MVSDGPVSCLWYVLGPAILRWRQRQEPVCAGDPPRHPGKGRDWGEGLWVFGGASLMVRAQWQVDLNVDVILFLILFFKRFHFTSFS